VLIRATLAAAVELGRPIQFHIGLGDPDIRMWRVDPTLLTDWLHRHRVPVMLLHCWPYQRQASYLAAVHPHVHLDVGLALHFVGPTRAAAVLAEAAELAPYGKLLYSSDAFGLPELYFLGALTFRRALGSLLTERTAAGEWSVPDAYRIAAMVAHENATRVYELK
jgi:predicted TIM-barrel fold metal-dependent hydrolase